MNGNTSMSPSCTRYTSAVDALNASFESAAQDESFGQRTASASGGSAGDSMSPFCDARTPHPPAKTRMSVSSYRMFDPLFKTPHTPLNQPSVRPSPVIESPAVLSSTQPWEGPLVPVTPASAPTTVASSDAPVAAATSLVSAYKTAFTPQAANASAASVAAFDSQPTPMTATFSSRSAAAVASPARVNGTSDLADALEVICILKATNEELLHLIGERDERIECLTQELEKLRAKMRNVLSSLAE